MRQWRRRRLWWKVEKSVLGTDPRNRFPAMTASPIRRSSLTIRDVAARAGLSPTTVSRVLNGDMTVREMNRARVLEVIAQLDYRPNRVASNLRRQKAEMIGVVVSDIENPHFARAVRGIEDAAHQRGYRVLLCNTDENATRQRDYLDILAAERVSGVIISPTDPAGDEISALLDLGVPMVAFDRTVNDRRADAVLADNAGAAEVAVEHLVRYGHRSIGLLGAFQVETGLNRLRGYEDAMGRARLPLHAVEAGVRVEDGRAAAERLLDEAPELTALIPASNFITAGALQVLRERRVKVPQELSVVAFDDQVWVNFIDPPLTTLAQPVRQMARAAIDLLLERIADPDRPSRRVVLDFHVRVRESCGPPPA
jgi:DNA-binding LacI/PurR family transcriptional regulator